MNEDRRQEAAASGAQVTCGQTEEERERAPQALRVSIGTSRYSVRLTSSSFGPL